MSEAEPTHESDSVAGWILRASKSDVDLDTVLARFGQIYRIPTTTKSLEPSTPCFLVRTDGNRVVGLWAVGEVVAPNLELPPNTALLPGELPLGPAVRSEQHRHYAEVELFPIAKPVPIAKLLEDEQLEGSELANWQSASSHTALALSAQQVRAIEAFEWWIEEPSEDQRAELDQLLADEDPILDRLEASD